MCLSVGRGGAGALSFVSSQPSNKIQFPFGSVIQWLLSLKDTRFHLSQSCFKLRSVVSPRGVILEVNSQCFHLL